MMENLNIYVPRLLDAREYFSAGHRACQGCGETVALRQILKAAGRSVILVNATGCSEIISSPFPQTAWHVPWIHVAFENAAAVASGVEAGLKALVRKGRLTERGICVMAIAGDGATADIGFQALSGAAERGHNFVYVCLDNEAYMNTGIQRSSSTPFGAMTTTSPPGRKSKGQKTWKKNLTEIMVAHEIPYVATASPSYPFDLVRKVKRAIEVDGPAYLHVLAVCPTGWRSATEETIRLGRLAAECGVFPLYEVDQGKYTINVDPGELKPLKDYLSIQGRFRHLTPDDVAYIQARIRANMDRLRAKVRMTAEGDPGSKAASEPKAGSGKKTSARARKAARAEKAKK
jgi:pyruvate ferredoxin oxidoreductase beta subunit